MTRINARRVRRGFGSRRLALCERARARRKYIVGECAKELYAAATVLEKGRVRGTVSNSIRRLDPLYRPLFFV